MQTLKHLAAVAIAAHLAACGGGGSGSASSSAPAAAPPPQGPTAQGVASAEGLWEGSSTEFFSSPRLLILENGEVWDVYGGAPGGNAISGLLQGVTSWDGTKITSSVTDFNGRAGLIGASTLAGTYSAKGTLTATTLHQGAAVTLTTTYRASYELPAKLSDVQGYWQVLTWSKGGQVSSNVNVAANGTFTSASLFCTGAGTVTPRASGKNVFDLTITFGAAANCEFSGRTLTGIAFVESFSSDPQLILTGAQADKLNAFAGYGIR